MVSASSGEITLYEAFFGKKPTMSHMRIWYSVMFIHQPKLLSAGKLGEQGQHVRFLGYPGNSAGYKAYNPHTHKVTIICTPLFREEAQPTENAMFKTTGVDYSSTDEGDVVPPVKPVAPSDTPN